MRFSLRSMLLIVALLAVGLALFLPVYRYCFPGKVAYVTFEKFRRARTRSDKGRIEIQLVGADGRCESYYDYLSFEGDLDRVTIADGRTRRVFGLADDDPSEPLTEGMRKKYELLKKLLKSRVDVDQLAFGEYVEGKGYFEPAEGSKFRINIDKKTEATLRLGADDLAEK